MKNKKKKPKRLSSLTPNSHSTKRYAFCASMQLVNNSPSPRLAIDFNKTFTRRRVARANCALGRRYDLSGFARGRKFTRSPALLLIMLTASPRRFIIKLAVALLDEGPDEGACLPTRAAGRGRFTDSEVSFPRAPRFRSRFSRFTRNQRILVDRALRASLTLRRSRRARFSVVRKSRPAPTHAGASTRSGRATFERLPSGRDCI